MHGDHAAVFETDHGAVLRCACCERLLVRFGNALFSLDRPEFARLRHLVGAADVCPGGGDSSGRPVSPDCMVLHATDPGMAFVFTRGERAEFGMLLEGAALLLEIGDIKRQH
jgi:hypothetical protein